MQGPSDPQQPLSNEPSPVAPTPNWGSPIPSPTGESNQLYSPTNIGPNDSGTGGTAVLPAELRGLNWGAFLLNWIWAIAHSTWLGLLCLVPYVGWVMGFVLLFKGNEWAWQNRRWTSIEEFRLVQSKWTMWGLIILGLGFLVGILAALVIVGTMGTTVRSSFNAAPAPP